MMGREKVEAAFSREGARDTPAVICYEDIYVRDHWDQLTDYPWWYNETSDLEHQMLWRRQAISRTGQDWFLLPRFFPTEEQRNLSIDVRPEGVYQIDARTGLQQRLIKPMIGGWSSVDGLESVPTPRLPETPDEIDAFVPIESSYDPYEIVKNGSSMLAAELLEEFGQELFPICHVGSPLWGLYRLWGFEGMMILMATRPDLVRYACERLLVLRIRAVREAALLGAAGIWIPECMMDMISPQAFSSLNVPVLRGLVEAIRAEGMKSIYGYCGSPAGKWDLLFAVGADALALEESKKNFTIDIEDVVEKAQGRCTVLGNLDAIGVLQDGTEEELRTEIARQIAAGRRNGSRFIMSIGSPVTPATPVDRVRLYGDMAHELGAHR